MDNLNLTRLGVKQLDTMETVNIDGGLILASIATFVVGAWLADSIFNYGETVESFKKGLESVK